MDVVTQRGNERSRTVVEGHRTDDGDCCKLVVVHEVTGDCWALYPHGWGKFGVRPNSGGGIAMTEQCDLDDVADAMDAVGSAVVEAVDATVMRRSTPVPSHEYVAALHVLSAVSSTGLRRVDLIS